MGLSGLPEQHRVVGRNIHATDGILSGLKQLLLGTRGLRSGVSLQRSQIQYGPTS